jgi:hypothetical protein
VDGAFYEAVVVMTSGAKGIAKSLFRVTARSTIGWRLRFFVAPVRKEHEI